MKLWLISQDTNNNYDTFDSAVVRAETEDEARQINPSGDWGSRYGGWCATPDQVKVELIGEAIEGSSPGIVLASFNAG